MFTRSPLKVLIAACLMVSAAPTAVRSGVALDVEGGRVFGGYNDVRIPGTTGTLFSLSEDLDADPGFFFRGKVSYSFGQRNTVELLIAPLSVESNGRVQKDIYFDGVTFPAGTQLQATYKFNSYRLTYRWRLTEATNLQIGLGVTAKIRDAEVALSGGGLESSYTNLGFVPLVNFRVLYALRDRFSVLLAGDALAAPQGRAEDVLAAVVYRATDRVSLKLGYRMLEGGADNEKVYTFALFHYAVFGVVIGL